MEIASRVAVLGSSEFGSMCWEGARADRVVAGCVIEHQILGGGRIRRLSEVAGRFVLVAR